MGLKDTLIDAVKSASDALGDLRETVTYNRVTAIGNYDPSTGTTSTTESTVSLTIPIVRTTEQEFDSKEVLKNTQKALVPAKDITFVPGPDDYFTINSETWEIVQIDQVPGDSVYILYIRRP